MAAGAIHRGDASACNDSDGAVPAGCRFRRGAVGAIWDDCEVSKLWIDLTEALNHHQGRGESNRTRVRDEIDRVGGVQFRTNVHGFWNSIQVFNGSGEIVADLMKTQVRYTPDSAPPEAEDRDSKDGWRVVSLDGVRRASGSERTARPEPRNAPTCSRCFIGHAGDECY